MCRQLFKHKRVGLRARTLIFGVDHVFITTLSWQSMLLPLITHKDGDTEYEPCIPHLLWA